MTNTQKTSNVAVAESEVVAADAVAIVIVPPITEEILMQNLPIGAVVAPERLTSMIQRITAELVAGGAIFNDKGEVINFTEQMYASVVNPIMLTEFREEFENEIRAELTAPNGIVKQLAPWLGGEEYNLVINRLVTTIFDSNFDAGDAAYLEIVREELGKLQPPEQDPAKLKELENFIQQHTRPVQTKNPLPDALPTTVEQVKKTEVIAGTDTRSNLKVEITATDTKGNPVKVSKVEISSSMAPYEPTFQHECSDDGRWIAVASPIPAVSSMKPAEIKDVVAKTIVAFRGYNGNQCEWNERLIFPDREVDLSNMFTANELNVLVWGFDVPDLSCWDIQSVTPRVYGLDFTYRKDEAA